jgi:predicted dinucleotide-binding enzyme
MATAIIGVRNFGKAAATHLTEGGEAIVVEAQRQSSAEQLAREPGASASAASAADAFERADAVLFAFWFDPMTELNGTYASKLDGKVVIDPSNPIAPDGKGGLKRTLPDGVSPRSVSAGLLPSGAHLVKAFGTVSAEHLADAANQSPERAVLFYATDDDAAAATADRLIAIAGFAPVKAGGLDQAIRIEVFGDLHDYGRSKYEAAGRVGVNA